MKAVKTYHRSWLSEIKVSEIGKIIGSASIEEIRDTKKEVLSVLGGKRR
jgi:hypothetical protein